MKHSLGPYRFEGNKIVCAAGYNVATVNSHATSEGLATGALLAAAPDLLKALQIIKRESRKGKPDPDVIHAAAHDAITKARG